jgi:hypothetical protein
MDASIWEMFQYSSPTCVQGPIKISPSACSTTYNPKIENWERFSTVKFF